MNSKKVAIVGGGLVGSLLAIYLARRRYQVDVFERRADMRKDAIAGGRSINLALSNRGWWPLKDLGLEQEVKDLIIPMHGRMMHSTTGELTFQPYGKEGQSINSVSRGGLNKLLLNCAEREGAKIHFERKCEYIDFENSCLKFASPNGEIVHKPDLIIGCDGAYSAIRKDMQWQNRFNYQQFYLEHGYKELTIPAQKGGGFLIEKNALHIWPRGNFMLIALPNLDGTFTCTLFLPYEGKSSFNNLGSNPEIRHFFESQFPDAFSIMPSLFQDFEENPTSSLVTIQCYPWVRNKTLLIGDASHAIVPFYGQGMNSGFEDCRVLNGLLEEHHDDWDKVLPYFQKLRKPDADAISELALNNFIEMRDLVADESFLIRKKIEAKLHELFPEKWIPLYSMVTFNEKIRYSEALAEGRRQKEIMDEVMKKDDIASEWENLDLKAIVDQLNS